METKEMVDVVLKTSEGISNFGMMTITAGFFLVLSAIMMISYFRWLMKIINSVMESQRETLKELLDEAKTQNEKLTNLSEGLMPETQLRLKTVSGLAFDLLCEKSLRLLKKVRIENHISNKEATAEKVRRLLTIQFEDINSKFDSFFYRGRALTYYTNKDWVEQVAKAIELELYHENGENEERERTNIESQFSKIKLEFYHNMQKYLFD